MGEMTTMIRRQTGHIFISVNCQTPSHIMAFIPSITGCMKPLQVMLQVTEDCCMTIVDIQYF